MQCSELCDGAGHECDCDMFFFSVCEPDTSPSLS